MSLLCPNKKQISLRTHNKWNIYDAGKTIYRDRNHTAQFSLQQIMPNNVEAQHKIVFVICW